jgi:hypothetical protein
LATRLPVFGPPLAAALVFLLSAAVGAIAADPDGQALRDREELAGYARDTWKSVAAMGDCADLPVDALHFRGNGTWKPFELTTPTDVGAYLWSVLAAERLKIIAPREARQRTERTLKSLERLRRAHGFLLDKLDPRTGTALKTYPGGASPIPPIASSVDNGWLAAGLIMVRNAYPTLRDRADSLLKPMDFGFFYAPYRADDPTHHPGQIREPYWIDRQSFGGFNRIINTEQRIVSYIGIARGQVPPEHYYRVERTLKHTECDQFQAPAGEIRTYFGIPVFEGHYTYRGMRIVPSWGGSMFEDLMVPLFVPEERWAPRSWGVNHALYVRAQIEFGLNEAGYGYWGFSPASNPDGGYRTYGVDALGSDPLGYGSGNDKTRTKSDQSTPQGRLKNGVVTPYASFLALRFAPREALENLRKLRANFNIYGDHGFMDAVNVSSGQVADRVLILDQGMILAAIANALANDAMRAAFIDPESERVLRPLIAPEEFTAGLAPRAPATRPVSTRARPPNDGPSKTVSHPPSADRPTAIVSPESTVQ